MKPDQRFMKTFHDYINVNLTGESLETIVVKYQEFLVQQFAEFETIGDDWVDVADLSVFIRDEIMAAALTSIFGPHFLRLNPNFIEDFWPFTHSVGELFLGMPRWLRPSIYARRDRMVKGIERWHRYAIENYKAAGGKGTAGSGEEAWEPFFGSKFSRKRHGLFDDWECMDARAKASEDMAFIWA